MSAIGESFSNICLEYLNIKSLRLSTSGVHSSIRNTFLPPSPRRAGSRYTISGANGLSISVMVSCDAMRLLILILDTPSVLKLWPAAVQRAPCISLYRTSEAFFEKNQLSTPNPPVRSARRKLPPAICSARSALYIPVAVLLHCSADRRTGKTRPGSLYHSGTLFFSFLRLSMQATAVSMSISGHLARSRISLDVSSSMCSCTKTVSLSISFLLRP